MLPEVEFYHPEVWEASELAANLRDQDREEIRALGVADPVASIEWGIRNSSTCWAARAEGKIGCIFGAANGVVWMLGTPLVVKYRRNLAAQAPGYIKQMLQTHGRLYNVVHAKNTNAVRWLKRAGFTLQEASPFGPHGEMFHFFEMTNDV